nr:hypothetical protein [Bacteroidota bacterium]
ASYSTTAAPALYNGNISSWLQSQLNTLNTMPALPRGDLYKYDILNRIKQSTSLEYNTASATSWTAVTGNSPANAANAFKTTYNYDANGNILKLQRYDENGVLMDNMDYSYDAAATLPAKFNNKLSKVQDLETTNVLIGRGDLESTHTYSYDAIGNMTLEVGPERLNINATPGLYSTNTQIEWTVYGKINKVKKDITGPASVSYKEEINFGYDASGNRIKKEYWKDSQQSPNGIKDPQEFTTTYYVRDAQGNVMGTYKRYFDPTDSKYKIDLIEEAIYGSDRLGQNSRKINLQTALTAAAITTPTNGVAITSEYQNWITAANKTSTIIPNDVGDLCQCKIVSMSNPVVSGAYSNTAIATDFLGIANNGVAVAEDLTGSLQFHVVLAKKYLGVNDVCLVYDKNGKLMQSSQNIGQVDPLSKPIIINFPNTKKYAILTLGVDKQVKYHIVDMTEVGYALVGNAGKVINANLALPVTSGTTTAYGYHFTAAENHINNQAVVYASRYTPNVTNTLTGTTEIVAYEFSTPTAQPTEYVMYNMSGCGSTETGQLQISPNGNKLAWYQHDKSISGFKMRQGYLYTMPLNASKTAVSGTVDIHPISTAGNFGNGALEFMTNSNDLLYSQYGAYKQNSNAATKYDRNVWKYDAVTLGDISINPNLPTLSLVTYMLGEIKRGNDGKYYIPNLAEVATAGIHSYDGSLWNNGINTALTSYSYAASWPTQVWKLYADPTQTLSAYTRYIGDKQYELKDHLGNVKTVISDEKMITDMNSDNIVDNSDSYTPKVLNYGDYYAFGMALPGRKYSAGSDYRYGYNGQEKDDEIASTGNRMAALFWEYDTRTGRRWNLDPKPQTGISEYSTFNNSPIFLNDPNGDCPWCVALQRAMYLIQAGVIYYGQNQNTINSFAWGLFLDEDYAGPQDDVGRLTRGGLSKLADLTKKNHFVNILDRYSFREFTYHNFRHNLSQIITAPVIKVYNSSTKAFEIVAQEAHHIFAQKFRARFQKFGINVDNPILGTWWHHVKGDKTGHKSLAAEVNTRWGDALDIAEQMLKKYGENEIGFKKSSGWLFEEALYQAKKYGFNVSFNPVGMMSDMKIFKSHKSFTKEAWKAVVDTWKEADNSDVILKEFNDKYGAASWEIIYKMNK